MMHMNRKTTPKVRGGKVQKKNRWVPTATYYNTPQPYPAFVKERPGPGFKHLIHKCDLEQFVDILPEWKELSKGLNAVVLAPGRGGCMGWHRRGVVGICAWDRELAWEECLDPFFHEHRGLLEKLNIPYRPNGKYWTVDFDADRAKAFQLIHIFIHELGHHHDRMTTRSKANPARGEGFAEQYANLYENQIVDAYMDTFGLL